MRSYKLFSSSTASAGGVTQLRMNTKTRIRGILFSLSLTGGAGVGRLEVELSKQNASNLATNDSPPTVLASAAVAVGNATTAADNTFIACDLPVESGDTLYLNQLVAGTTPASAATQVYLYT